MKLAQKLGQFQPFVYSHRNAWANLHLLSQPDSFLDGIKGPDGCLMGSCRRAALNFTSNQLVVFERGVVVEALRWDFHGPGDVFAYVGNDFNPVRNLTIRGEGN